MSHPIPFDAFKCVWLLISLVQTLVSYSVQRLIVHSYNYFDVSVVLDLGSRGFKWFLFCFGKVDLE